MGCTDSFAFLLLGCTKNEWLAYPWVYDGFLSFLMCFNSHLRHDTLAQMLTLGNIHAGSKVLVFETCSGLVLGAVMERMGGTERCPHLDIILHIVYNIWDVYYIGYTIACPKANGLEFEMTVVYL